MDISVTIYPDLPYLSLKAEISKTGTGLANLRCWTRVVVAGGEGCFASLSKSIETITINKATVTVTGGTASFSEKAWTPFAALNLELAVTGGFAGIESLHGPLAATASEITVGTGSATLSVNGRAPLTVNRRSILATGKPATIKRHFSQIYCPTKALYVTTNQASMEVVRSLACEKLSLVAQSYTTTNFTCERQRLVCSTVTVAVAARPAIMSRSIILEVISRSFISADNACQLLRERRLTTLPRVLVISPIQALFRFSWRLRAVATGAHLFLGETTLSRVKGTLHASSAIFAVTGKTGQQSASRKLWATVERIAVNVSLAGVTPAREMLFLPGVFVFNGLAARLDLFRRVSANVTAMSLSVSVAGLTGGGERVAPCQYDRVDFNAECLSPSCIHIFSHNG